MREKAANFVFVATIYVRDPCLVFNHCTHQVGGLCEFNTVTKSTLSNHQVYEERLLSVEQSEEGLIEVVILQKDEVGRLKNRH